MSVPAITAWKGPYNRSQIITPGEIGLCRHWYVADEANLERDVNNRATTIANLGSEGDATGLAISRIYNGRQAIRFEQAADAMTSLLGFTGTDLTIFAAAVENFGGSLVSVADRSGGTFGGPTAAFFEQNGSEFVNAFASDVPDSFGHFGAIQFSEINPRYRVVGMRVSFVNSTPVLNPLYGPDGLMTAALLAYTPPVPGPFTAAHTVTLGYGTFSAPYYTIFGLLRGVSIHEGLLTDEEMLAVGEYWSDQLRGAEIPAPLRFSQVTDYLESPEPAVTDDFVQLVTRPSDLYFYGTANKRFKVDGNAFTYLGSGNTPTRIDGAVPRAVVSSLTVGGIILPLDTVQGIYSVGAVTVALTEDGRIRVETEHNAAQSEPLVTGVPHSFLVQVDFNGADADAHIPTLIIDGVSDKTLDGAGFGARTVAYETPTLVKYITVGPKVYGNLIFNKLFMIEDLPNSDQVADLVAFLESGRTTGGVLSGTLPLAGLRTYWPGRLSSYATLSPIAFPSSAWSTNGLETAAHNVANGLSGFVSPVVLRTAFNWIGNASTGSADQDLMHNGGPVTIYFAGYFPPVRGALYGSGLLSTIPPGLGRGFFFGYLDGQLHVIVRKLSGIVLDVAFDFEGVGGVVIQLNYGGSPEYLIETIDIAGVRSVVASGSFDSAPESGAATSTLHVFGNGSTDKLQVEAAIIGYWAGIVDIDMIAAEQVAELVGTDDAATIAARSITYWPRVQIAVKYDQRAFGVSLVDAQIYYWSGAYYGGAGNLDLSSGSEGRAILTAEPRPFLRYDWQLRPFLRLAPRMTLTWVGKVVGLPLSQGEVLTSWMGINPYVFDVRLNNGKLIFHIQDYTFPGSHVTMEFDDGLADNSIVKTYLCELDFNEAAYGIFKAVYIDGVLIPGVVVSIAGAVQLPVSMQGYPVFGIAYRSFSAHNTIYPEVFRQALQDLLESYKDLSVDTKPENFGFAEDCYLLDDGEASTAPLIGHWANRVNYRLADDANISRRFYNLINASAPGTPFGTLVPEDRLVVFTATALQTTLHSFDAPLVPGQGKNPSMIDGYTVSFVAKSPASGEVRVIGKTGTEPLTIYIDDTGLRVIASGSGNTVEVRVNGFAADTIHSYLVEIDFFTTGDAAVKAIIVNATEPAKVVLQNDPLVFAFPDNQTWTVGEAGLQLRGLASHRQHFAPEVRDLLVGFWENHKL